MRIEKLTQHHHDELSQKLIQQKSAFAFVTDEGETIACAGIVELAGHPAGELWFKKGLAIKQGTIEMLRYASKLLEEEMQRIGMISIWGHVYCDREEDVKFARVMGMQCLATVPRMGKNGKDMFLFWKGL